MNKIHSVCLYNNNNNNFIRKIYLKMFFELPILLRSKTRYRKVPKQESRIRVCMPQVSKEHRDISIDEPTFY